MLRAGVLAFGGVFGGIAAFVVSVIVGVNTGSWLAFFVCLLITGAAVYFGYKLIWNAGRVNMDTWLASASGYKYKYAWDGFGIAIDPLKNTIMLASKFGGARVNRTYPISSIRTWEYKIKGSVVHQADQHIVYGGGMMTQLQSASHNVGASIGAGLATIGSNVMAEEQTGLTLKLADVEYPVWFIKFKPEKHLEMTLARWVEILQQSVAT